MLREPWADTTGPVRDLLVAVMGWVAQQERARLLERLAAARARLEKEGRSWGRPRRLDAAAAERVGRMKANLGLLWFLLKRFCSTNGPNRRDAFEARAVARDARRRVGSNCGPGV